MRVAGCLASVGSRVVVAMEANAAKIASPIAVLGASLRWSRFRNAPSRSVVGATSTLAVPEKEMSPSLNWRGRPLTNSAAAFLATVIRLGAISVALIESETSMASTTVAPSRATFTDRVGRCEPEDHDREGEEHRGRGHVPSPTRPSRCNRGKKIDVGEAHDRVTSPALQEDVQAEQRGDRDEQPEPGGGVEGHRRTGPRSSAGAPIWPIGTALLAPRRCSLKAPSNPADLGGP